MKLLEFYTEIHLPAHVSPDDPIILFIIYYSPEIIEYIIEITNLNPRTSQDPGYSYARAVI
jgi:hypothetical protein